MGWEAINFKERSKGQKYGFGSYQEAKKVVGGTIIIRKDDLGISIPL